MSIRETNLIIKEFMRHLIMHLITSSMYRSIMRRICRLARDQLVQTALILRKSSYEPKIKCFKAWWLTDNSNSLANKTTCCFNSNICGSFISRCSRYRIMLIWIGCSSCVSNRCSRKCRTMFSSMRSTISHSSIILRIIQHHSTTIKAP